MFMSFNQIAISKQSNDIIEQPITNALC